MPDEEQPQPAEQGSLIASLEDQAAPPEAPATEAPPSEAAVPPAEAPVAAAPPTPESPAAPAVPETAKPDPQVTLLQEQLVIQAQHNQQLRVQAQQREQAEAVRNYEAALVGQGYSPDQVAAGMQEFQRVQAQRMEVEQRSQTLAAREQEHEALAKSVVVAQLAMEYGVEAKDLQELNDPTVMLERAQRLKAEAALKSARTAAAPAQSFDSSPASPGASNSRNDRLDRLNSGQYVPTTDADWAELEKVMNSQ
jgi:hypothetical protein